jgi:hypothetical protein
MPLAPFLVLSVALAHGRASGDACRTFGRSFRSRQYARCAVRLLLSAHRTRAPALDGGTMTFRSYALTRSTDDVRRAFCVLATGILLMSAARAHAAADPELVCQGARYAAKAKYNACQQLVTSHLFTTGPAGKNLEKFEQALAKCDAKYSKAWTDLQKKANGTGSLCDAPRYLDTGNGTVTDRLTGLQWEQKTEGTGVHGKDRLYTWSATVVSLEPADGTLFTTFLATLNSGACFAGHCDWRLPTIYELQTVLREPYQCGPPPCIDATVFGPTPTPDLINGEFPSHYWASNTNAADPNSHWLLFFDVGAALFTPNFGDGYARAVRGGL